MEAPVDLQLDHGSHSKANSRTIGTCTKLFLYLFAVLEGILALGMIGGGILDALLMEDDSRFHQANCYLAAIIGTASFICGCTSTDRVDYSTVKQWTIVHWAFFSILLLIMVELGLKIEAVIGMSILGVLLLMKLIFSIIFTALSTVPYFARKSCC